MAGRVEEGSVFERRLQFVSLTNGSFFGVDGIRTRSALIKNGESSYSPGYHLYGY